MTRNISILLLAAVIVALPFVLRKPAPEQAWREGDPVVVVITPHTASIREEFGDAFSEWHQQHYGSPARVDWRVIGGTTEIMRYLESEYAISDTCKMDVFYGGGQYDHDSAERKKLTVPLPSGVFDEDDYPLARGGEIWRGNNYVAAALATFGIVYNPDRLDDLGIDTPPATWRDLADPRYRRYVGVTDPTKSGSIAKAFEMIIHTECRRAVLDAGFTRDDIHAFEADLPNAPAAYTNAITQGWLEGIRTVQLIGANARYFTDGSSKVSMDVSSGDIAAGVSIDSTARAQSEVSGHGIYITPVGGSSVSADPISLLRGAPNPVTAERFLAFVLSLDGQKLWNYRPGAPGGPKRYALRRLPAHKAFYSISSFDVESSMFDVRRYDNITETSNIEHRTSNIEYNAFSSFTTDDLLDPSVSAWALSEAFEYVPRWTASHFATFRLLIRVMCMDSGDALKDAWDAIIAHGGPDAQPAAMSQLTQLPPGLAFDTAASFAKADPLETARQWTLFFRDSYAKAQRLVQ
ncbi:MAG: ABC transporter substrate-binding protein [Kiritimatiellaeota bacterium]|nr:ABC transporter substrate-binding protein [Kiritimatiellota bacterium]